MNNWPDPEKPGVPLNPERNGYHWLFNPDDDRPHPVIWVANLGAWAVGDVWTPRIVAEISLHYQGPLLTPAETDALRAENARLREALSFYVRIRAQPVELVKDFGNTAEAALEWKP
jgi:hypothetical protein